MILTSRPDSEGVLRPHHVANSERDVLLASPKRTFSFSTGAEKGRPHTPKRGWYTINQRPPAERVQEMAACRWLCVAVLMNNGGVCYVRPKGNWRPDREV